MPQRRQNFLSLFLQNLAPGLRQLAQQGLSASRQRQFFDQQLEQLAIRSGLDPELAEDPTALAQAIQEQGQQQAAAQRQSDVSTAVQNFADLTPSQILGRQRAMPGGTPESEALNSLVASNVLPQIEITPDESRESFVGPTRAAPPVQSALPEEAEDLFALAQRSSGQLQEDALSRGEAALAGSTRVGEAESRASSLGQGLGAAEAQRRTGLGPFEDTGRDIPGVGRVSEDQLGMAMEQFETVLGSDAVSEAQNAARQLGEFRNLRGEIESSLSQDPDSPVGVQEMRLATQVARTIEPSGRLSDQDLERFLPERFRPMFENLAFRMGRALRQEQVQFTPDERDALEAIMENAVDSQITQILGPRIELRRQALQGQLPPPLIERAVPSAEQLVPIVRAAAEGGGGQQAVMDPASIAQTLASGGTINAQQAEAWQALPPEQRQQLLREAGGR